MIVGKLAVVMVLAGVMVFVALPQADAELWDLIIVVSIENSSIISGETVAIDGRVVDHAYDPIRGAEVLVRTGPDTIKTFTDPYGTFSVEFEDVQRAGGTYPINIVATWYNMTGLTTTSFDVRGNADQASILMQQLSTEQARKYLSSEESDFDNNPIGQILFNHYHDLLNELIAENKQNAIPDERQARIDAQREAAEEIREREVESYKPGAGIYEGTPYEYFISSLDLEVRDLIASQINFTKNTFENAQLIRDEILRNGGTYEEAQRAYLNAVAIPKEVLENVGQEPVDDQ